MSKEKMYTEKEYNEIMDNYIRTLDELKETTNDYYRALADAENIKKNFAKKQADLYEYRYEPIMRELLDVLDDVDRGVANNAFSEGGRLIFHKLSNILAKNNLEQIFPVYGEEFNADTMEAVATQPVEGNEGKVVGCTLCGYKYNGKIIRYPKVVVGV